jgi:hypothetical protein
MSAMAALAAGKEQAIADFSCWKHTLLLKILKKYIMVTLTMGWNYTFFWTKWAIFIIKHTQS